MWYGIVGLGCALAVLFWKYRTDVGRLEGLVDEQNKMMRENIVQLRDEYARVFGEITKGKKKGKKE